MINKMREMAPVIMLVILVSFVIGTIFLDWGMNITSKTSKVSAAGKVNNKEIPISYFDRVVNQERQKLQQEKKDVSPYEYYQLPRQIWEREVNRILTQDVYKKLQLSASGDEVFEYIKTHPLPGIDTASIFQTNGMFDTSKYVRFLNTPENYKQYPWLTQIESYTRDEIIPAQKFEKLLNAPLIPTKAEIEYKYRLDNEKLVFEFVKVQPFSITVDSNLITPVAVKNYYNSHRDSFKTEGEVDLYYVKFPKTPTAEDEKSYYQEMVDLKQKILSKQTTFEEAATVESDDPGSAQNGGDLGWFTKGRMVPEFDSVAFSLDTGTISDPIRTQFGYHLILVEKREGKDTTLKVKARHILRNIVPTIETLDKLAEHADSLRDNMIEQGFVKAAQADKSVSLQNTGLFKQGDMIPGVGFVSGINNFAFNQEKDAVSERLENNEAYYLFSIKTKVPKGYLALDLVKDRIKQKIADSLRTVKAKEHIESIYKRNPASLATIQNEDASVNSGISDTVAKGGMVPALGYSNKGALIAYELSVGQLSSPIEDNGSYMLVRPLWKSSPAQVDWNSPSIRQYEDQIKNETMQRIYYSWYIAAKKRAKIQSNIDKIYID